MKHSKPLLLTGLFIAVAILFTAPVQAADAPRAKHVFIISFDQGNPDLIQKSDLPVFHDMAVKGARTWDAYTIVPSVTLPSHVSMLTGVGIQKHQITWNGHEPDRGPLKVPTVFSLAKERGLVTAMYVGKEKLRLIELPDSVDAFAWPQPEDDARAVAAAFAGQVGELKPNVCFIHFRDPDTIGHKHGAYSPEKVQALKDCDEALGTIREAIARAGILDESVIILTADHGGHDTRNREGETVGTHGSPDSEDVRIPWVAWGKSVKADYAITAPVVQYDTAATALWLLGIEVPEHFWGRPVTSAFE